LVIQRFPNGYLPNGYPMKNFENERASLMPQVVRKIGWPILMWAGVATVIAVLGRLLHWAIVSM
jgi:hypothetical protein|tara:strand:- start:63 stop:254 length:192 start_codon:yes stop_codon:yes gene_type:complete